MLSYFKTFFNVLEIASNLVFFSVFKSFLVLALGTVAPGGAYGGMGYGGIGSSYGALPTYGGMSARPTQGARARWRECYTCGRSDECWRYLRHFLGSGDTAAGAAWACARESPLSRFL